jgi:hypothetical protein
MQVRARHQRGQTLHELQRPHQYMRGAVAVGTLQLQHDLAGAITLEAIVGNGGASDTAAHTSAFYALMDTKAQHAG